MIKNIILLFGLFFYIFFTYQHIVIADNTNNNLEQRLNNLVSKHSISLTEQDRATVVANCNKLQAQIADNQFSVAIKIRQQSGIYSNIQNEIKALELRMIRQGIDASELDLIIGKIQEKQDQIIITTDEMGKVAEDARIINCQQRPEQFMASLAEYKYLQTNLLTKSRQLRVLVLTASETTFNPLKKRLSL